MISTEFAIIDDPNIEFLNTKENSDCVAIDDDEYISDWWPRLALMKTYFYDLDHPAIGLNRWGVTLIPPQSLATLEAIILEDKRIYKDNNLVALANLVMQAIDEKKFIIHFGA